MIDNNLHGTFSFSHSNHNFLIHSFFFQTLIVLLIAFLNFTDILEHPTSTTIAAATIIDPNLTPISGENIIDDDDEPNLLTPLLNNNRSTRR